MTATQHPIRQLGFIFGSAILGALAGCTTYVEERSTPEYVAPEPAPVYVAPAPIVVETPAPMVVEIPAAPTVVVIQAEADFYEPLTPYGRWVEVPGYGRCWAPGGVAADWRPYSNGHWEHTEAGWFWVSDEPWAWATYHYGRWDYSPEFGWYWVPQTQWAPAWVAWRRGGGYTGWAPLPPPRLERGARVEVDVNVIAPRSFVFVEERRFTEAHRPATVIVNNTKIVNQTVIINKTAIVNRTVVNAGPPVADVERSTGRAVPAAAGKDLRRTAEAPMAARPSAVPPRQTATPDRPAQKPAENVQGNPEAPARTAVTETNRPMPPVTQPARPSTPAASTPRPIAPAGPGVRPLPANPKPAVTETNLAKPSASPPARVSAPPPAPSKPAPVRPMSPPASSKPAVTETNLAKPVVVQPARPATPAAAMQRPTAPTGPGIRPPAAKPKPAVTETNLPKPAPVRSVSPPGKPSAPENPGAKPAPNDEKKKPEQP